MGNAKTGLIVEAARVITGAVGPGPGLEVLEDTAIYVEGGEILALGPAHRLRAQHPDAEVRGSAQYIAMPGMIDGHQHGRGLSYPRRGVSDEMLELWLLELKRAVSVDPYFASLLAATHLIRTGITTAVHSQVTISLAHYQTEAEETVRGYADSGLRTTFACDVRDRGFFAYEDDVDFLARLAAPLREKTLTMFPVRSSPPVDGLSESVAALRTVAGSRPISFCIGPQAPQWCTPNTLLRCGELAHDLGLGLHLHCAETRFQLEYFVRKHHKSPVAFLGSLGVLGPTTSLAHVVHIGHGDIELLASTDTTVVHNPSSNLRLRSGFAEVRELHDAGVSVGLGTDSLTLDDPPDFFTELRLATKLQSARQSARAPEISSGRWLSDIALNGAAALSGSDVGRIQPGYKADLLLLNARHVVGVSQEPPDSAELLLSGARADSIATVIVDGEVLFDGGKFIRVDPDGIMDGLEERLSRSRDTSRERKEIVKHLRPALEIYLDELGSRDLT